MVAEVCMRIRRFQPLEQREGELGALFLRELHCLEGEPLGVFHQ